MKHQTIPVINLTDFDNPTKRNEVIQQIGKGFHEVGFIAVENHGVDQRLIEQAYKIMESFFSRPLDTKTQYEDDRAFEPRGFSQMGKEHVKGQNIPDLKEFWHTGRESFEVASHQNKYPVNVWPKEEPKFRQVMLDLYDQLEDCACRILEASAMYLGLEPFFMCDMITDGNSVLRLAHYPPIPEGTNPSAFRSAPHEDIDFITLLCEANGEGLEILKKDGEWLPVHSYKGQIIVNVGDMLQNLSNGYYKSTTHRVTNNNLDRNRRLSMPFFVHPRPEIDLSPITSSIHDLGKVKYPQIKAGDYFNQRLTEIGFGSSRGK
jgi:isopenicillin N synthase-like dioxygenase